MALAAGDGVFSTVLLEQGRAFGWRRHLRRLAASARALGLPEVDPDLVSSRAAQSLASSPGGRAARMRLRLLWAATDRGGAALSIQLTPLPLAAGGARLVTSTVRRTAAGALGHHKTTAYVENLVAAAQARRAGGDEALLLTDAGQLCEGAGSNVFVVLDGEVLTPPLLSGCLPGLARAVLLERAQVRETDLEADVLARCAELFVTSSTREVQPVEWLRSAVAGPGEAVRGPQRSWPAPGPVTDSVRRIWQDVREDPEEWFLLG